MQLSHLHQQFPEQSKEITLMLPVNKASITLADVGLIDSSACFGCDVRAPHDHPTVDTIKQQLLWQEGSLSGYPGRPVLRLVHHTDLKCRIFSELNIRVRYLICYLHQHSCSRNIAVPHGLY